MREKWDAQEGRSDFLQLTDLSTTEGDPLLSTNLSEPGRQRLERWKQGRYSF